MHQIFAKWLLKCHTINTLAHQLSSIYMPSKFTLNRLNRKRCLANNKKQAEDRKVDDD